MRIPRSVFQTKQSIHYIPILYIAPLRTYSITVAVLQRKKLLPYLEVGVGYQTGDSAICRSYTRHRITELARYIYYLCEKIRVIRNTFIHGRLHSGYCLRDYKWAAGGKGWKKSLPTDAHVVANCFAVYMEEMVR